MATQLITPEKVLGSFSQNGSAVVVSFCASQYTNTKTRQTLEVRCFGTANNDASTPEYGTYSQTISVQGIFYIFSSTDSTTNVGLQHFESWLMFKTIVDFEFEVGVGAGRFTESGSATVTSVTKTLNSEGNSVYSVELAVRGIPTIVQETT